MFNSTVFYYDKALPESSQNQCISSGFPVFARDVSKDAKKAYMSCGYEHFCFNYYRKDNDQTRHTYELLQCDKPTKIYIDFDHDDVGDKVDFMKSTNEYIKAVLVSVATLSSDTSDIPIYIMESSTNAKLSRHVIFECFLENVKCVETFVHHVLETSPCKYLDKKVYTKNRLFRILYSYKFGKARESALTIGDDVYNPYSVFKTFIQAMIPAHYAGPFDVIKDELARHVTFLSLPSNSSSSKNGYIGSCSVDVPGGLGDFITKFSEDGALLSCKENETFIACIVGGKMCPWSQTVHRHNNAYFTICKSTMRGWFQCADQDCPMVPYGHVDVSCLWRRQFI
jgi:hypothetical protein